MVNVLEKPGFKKAWTIIGDGLSIKTERDYNRAVKMLNTLLDTVGDNETHPLYGFLDVLGAIIEVYEKDHFPVEGASGVEVLKSLMQEHGLKQSDLSEVASQGVISEILHGKRKLTLKQITILSKRFHISPAVFIEDKG